MKEKMKSLVGKLRERRTISSIFIALVALFALVGMSQMANAGDNYTQNEGGVLGLLIFFYLVGVVIVFLLLPQAKEKKLIPTIIAIGIAVAIVTVIFGIIDLAVYVPGVNFAFWTDWFNLSDYGALLIAMGWFIIILATLIAVYKIKEKKKELDALQIGIIGCLVWAIIFLVMYFVVQWDFLLGTP